MFLTALCWTVFIWDPFSQLTLWNGGHARFSCLVLVQRVRSLFCQRKSTFSFNQARLLFISTYKLTHIHIWVHSSSPLGLSESMSLFFFQDFLFIKIIGGRVGVLSGIISWSIDFGGACYLIGNMSKQYIIPASVDTSPCHQYYEWKWLKI